MTNKKVFITGISGQDGSLLAEFLLSKGYDVYGLMKENSCKDNLKNIIDNKNLNIIFGSFLLQSLL